MRGEVFIVTKGAQNIKLGLVEIVAIPEEKIERFIEGKVATINVEYNKYKSLEQGTSSQVNEAQQALDESRAKFDALTTQLLAARGMAEKVREDAASLYASPSYSSSEEVAAYQSALSRAEALKQKADQIAAQLETASSDVDSKRTSLSSARSASAGQLKKVINLLSEEQLFQGVPWEGPKATTNSDGQFSMKLVSNKRYVIAAKARRHVFDSTEQYYWLVWVSLQGEQPMRVMLTNNNLMGTDSADAVFKPKDLIPTGITEH